MKFVRIEEKKSGDVYDGFITREDKKQIEAICCGPDESSLLKRQTFERSKVILHERTKENIRLWFETAITHSEKKVLDAEFEVIFEKKELERRRGLFKEVFK